MAETLTQLRREFEEIKELAKSDTAEQKKYLLSIRTRSAHLESGFKLLGLRLRELMDAGNDGAAIDDFMNDREVVTWVRDLTGHRDACKADTTAALHHQTIASGEFDHRLAVLIGRLEGQINTREQKFSSKVLRINQSVKQMGPLLQEVKRFEQNSADLKAIQVAPAIAAANTYDATYNSLMGTTLSKAKALALTPAQQKLAKRLADPKVLATTYKNAKVIYDEVVRVSTKADQAKLARKAQGLSEARAAAKKAVAGVKELVDPYDEALKDAKVAEYVAKRPRSGEIKKSVNNLLDVQKMVGAKAKYILDLRV